MHGKIQGKYPAVRGLRKFGGVHMTYETIRDNPEIRAYIQAAADSMRAIGFTEHGFAHVTRVSERTAYILTGLGYDEDTVTLARIAAYLHDIGNLVNRVNHSQSGAIMAFRILRGLGMAPEDIATVVTAIGNHDEGTGVPVSAVAAALILADKSDVRRSRVSNPNMGSFDMHDRVNYSVESSDLTLSADKKTLLLSLSIDTKMSSVMDYFEIFLARMVLCRKAAEKLGVQFRLTINDQQLI